MKILRGVVCCLLVWQKLFGMGTDKISVAQAFRIFCVNERRIIDLEQKHLDALPVVKEHFDAVKKNKQTTFPIVEAEALVNLLSKIDGDQKVKLNPDAKFKCLDVAHKLGYAKFNQLAQKFARAAAKINDKDTAQDIIYAAWQSPSTDDAAGKVGNLGKKIYQEIFTALLADGAANINFVTKKPNKHYKNISSVMFFPDGNHFIAIQKEQQTKRKTTQTASLWNIASSRVHKRYECGNVQRWTESVAPESEARTA